MLLGMTQHVRYIQAATPAAIHQAAPFTGAVRLGDVVGLAGDRVSGGLECGVFAAGSRLMSVVRVKERRLG